MPSSPGTPPAHPSAEPRARWPWASGHPGRRARLASTAIAALLILVPLFGGRPSSRAAPVSGDGWQPLQAQGPVPSARSQFGMTSDTAGNVYIYGGAGTAGNALADFWLLRPDTATWQQLANGMVPPLIEPHLAADAAGNVYEFGGIGDPHGSHFTYDGHSFGLYMYTPSNGAWTDLTPADAQPAIDWPDGREDFGFALDPSTQQLFVFAGEGTGGIPLDDMWKYGLSSHTWTRITQLYSAPGGATIDPREIYNISVDNHGGFYLFGGSYLTAAAGAPTPPLYTNDLWHFDLASSTWSLLAGIPNGYDPSMPLPRHYYGQLCDAYGDFYILGGYISDTQDPPFFNNDRYAGYAHVVTLSPAPPAGLTAYAIADFWQFNVARHAWFDMSDQLGGLADQPIIPYNMARDTVTGEAVTFGGFHPSGLTTARSSGTWLFSLPSQPGGSPNGALFGPTPIAPPGSALATNTPSPTTLPSPSPVPAFPTGAPGTPVPASPVATARADRPRTTTNTGGSAMPRSVDVFGPGGILFGLVPQPGDDANPPLL